MNTNKEKYLDTTLVDVGKEILKNQLFMKKLMIKKWFMLLN